MGPFAASATRVRLLQVCAILLALTGISQLAEARCRSAKADDVPHGANMFILLAEKEVRQVRGNVFQASMEFAQDVVVEVYNFGGNDGYEAASQALKSKRIAACVTGPDGKFSFSGLKPGRYLLHLGTRDVAGMNEVNAILKVRPGGSRERLKIVLSLGT